MYRIFVSQFVIDNKAQWGEINFDEKSKKSQCPSVLRQYLKTQNKKSNPVIMKMKLKEN
jgi:hypothetical protein